MTKQNTSKNENALTALQSAIIDCGVETLTFTSHNIEKTVNVSDCADSSLIMLLMYGRQRKMNDGVNGKLKDLMKKEGLSESDGMKQIIDDFIDGMKNGFETTARKNTFDKLLFEQVKKWLIAKGKANTKSFNGLSKLNAEQLLNEFCKADGEEKNAERMQAFKKRVEDILATESSNIE